MKYLVSLIILFLLTLNGSAQFVIPDQAFALELQQLVPNAMNGNILDTTHSDVLTLTDMVILDSPDILSLDGAQYFEGLVQLTCFENNITEIPELPVNLVTLHCGDNSLVELPELPGSLSVLYCYDNQLSSLPQLSNTSLIQLHAPGNQLTSIPDLPEGILEVWCSGNQIVELPAVLPNTIFRLWLEDNQIESLPPLPDGLESLVVHNNQLIELPELPNGLIRLVCSDNQIGCLPALPNGLDVLQCHGSSVDCLPNLPPNLAPYSNTTWAYSTESNLGFEPLLCTANDICFPAEAITGQLFKDVNGNGIRDAGEAPKQNGVAQAYPGPYLSGPDINGKYGLPVVIGDYEVQGQPILYHTITTPPYSLSIAANQVDSLNDIGYQAVPGIYDIQSGVWSDVARSQFFNNAYLSIYNIGTEPTTVEIAFSFDNNQSWDSALSAPNTIVGNIASWVVDLAPEELWQNTVQLYTPAGTALDTPIEHILSAEIAQMDTTLDNNISVWEDVVRGAYDPNDKTAFPSSMTVQEIQSGQAIEYLIRFQNTGTYHAENVIITDTLSQLLNHDSFEYVSSSHDNYWHLAEGVLSFHFEGIMLPDSNANEPASHGYVVFRIHPETILNEGDSIVNRANIYFDFNEPVITEPSIFSVNVVNSLHETSSPLFSMYPNPVDDIVYVMSTSELRSILLLDVNGRLVWSSKEKGLSSEIDMSNFESGLYFINIVTNNGEQSSKVIVE